MIHTGSWADVQCRWSDVMYGMPKAGQMWVWPASPQWRSVDVGFWVQRQRWLTILPTEETGTQCRSSEDGVRIFEGGEEEGWKGEVAYCRIYTKSSGLLCLRNIREERERSLHEQWVVRILQSKPGALGRQLVLWCLREERCYFTGRRLNMALEGAGRGCDVQ